MKKAGKKNVISRSSHLTIITRKSTATHPVLFLFHIIVKEKGL